MLPSLMSLDLYCDIHLVGQNLV